MIFHAKSLLGTEKVTTTKICQLQFHTAFAHDNLTSNGQLRFTKNDLDGLDSNEKYPEPFNLLLNLDYKNIQSPLASEEVWHNRHEFDSNVCQAMPSILFTNENEMMTCLKSYDITKKKVYSDKLSVSPNNNNKNNNNQYSLAPKSYENGDSSSPLSSRSASPMPPPSSTSQLSNNEMPNFVKEANLLGLDEDDDRPSNLVI